MKYLPIHSLGLGVFALICIVMIAACGKTPSNISEPTASVTTAPVTTASVTTAPVTTASVTTASVTTAPVTTAPVTTAPVTTAPVTTAPVTTAPVTTAPVTTAPVTTEHIHNLGPWEVTTPATCTVSGIQTRTCTCGSSETMPIDPSGHTILINHAISPSCTTPGLTEGQYCSICHAVLVAQTDVQATGHRFSDWTITTPASCTQLGEQTRTCFCGARETKSIEPLEHMLCIDLAVEPSCSTPGLTEGSHCLICQTVFVAQTEIPVIEHTETVLIPGFAPTCEIAGITEKRGCSICDFISTEQETLPARGHSIIDGKCTVCGEAEKDYTDPNRYANDYGYRYLGTRENGAELQRLYRNIDAQMKAIHDDRSVDFTPQQFNNSTKYVALTFDLADYDIAETQIRLFTWIYYYDHPLYYWFDTIAPDLSSKTSLTYAITAFEEFADGDKRANFNRIIYDGVKEYTDIAAGETSAYLITMAYENNLYQRCSYEGQWSERVGMVLNAFEKQRIQCVGFAKTLQLLLNFSGIENIYIRGRVGGENGINHAWNLVRMDDGNWYWCDPTGNRFCMPESKLPSDYLFGEDFLTLYALPERAATPFHSEAILEIEETFIADGCTYLRRSYNSVACIATERGHKPPTSGIVSHDGKIYEILP